MGRHVAATWAYAARMNFAAGPPTLWRVTLTSGAKIELWADCFATEPVDGH